MGLLFPRLNAPIGRDAMPITDLNHYFVRANDLEKTKNFDSSDFRVGNSGRIKV
jgi:hypothetical protein